MRARKAKREIREPAHIRYAFYVLTLALAAIAIGSIILYGAGFISEARAEIASTVSMSLFFPFIVFTYFLAKGRNISSIVEELKISRKRLTYKALGAGLVLLIAVLLLEAGLAGLEQVAHVYLPTNVAQVLGGFPIWVLAFTVIIAPVNEEIFFRAFLVPRVGIVPSAILFALFHLGYGSIAEFVGALIYGLMAGYALKKTDSLYPSIIGHLLVNALAVVALVA
jgi:membrane protease YdiL (CAAX protease family)